MPTRAMSAHRCAGKVPQGLRRVDTSRRANDRNGETPRTAAHGATSTYSVVNRNVCYRAAAKITATAEIGRIAVRQLWGRNLTGWFPRVWAALRTL